MNLNEVLEIYILGKNYTLIEGVNNELYLPINESDLQKAINVYE